MNSICYILFDGLNAPGVANKIKSKVIALNKLNTNTRCIFFAQDFNEKNKSDFTAEFNFIKIPEIKIPNIFKNRILYIFQKIYFYCKQYNFVRKNLLLTKNEIILFRYPGADLSLLLFTLYFYKKIIFEFNSIEINEYKQRINYFLNNYYILSEKIFAPFIISFSKGIIGVTPEITNYNLKRAITKPKSICIENGIDITKIALKKETKITDNKINIICVVGAGNLYWYGIERLLLALTKKNNYQFNVYFVGNALIKFKQKTEELNLHNCFFIENKSTIQLQEIYNNMHVGMAALNMYKIGLNEASALKVKEYALAGLPIFCAYKEVSLDIHKNNFIYTYDNNDSPIDLNLLGDFLIKFYTDITKSSKLRDFAIKNYNYDNKAAELIKFINTICSND